MYNYDFFVIFTIVIINYDLIINNKLLYTIRRNDTKCTGYFKKHMLKQNKNLKITLPC